MTQTNVTPTPETNQPQETQEPIDNMGNPINADGSPREPSKEANEDKPSYEALEKALKDTKASLTKLQQGKEPEEQPEPTDTPDNLEISKQEQKAEEAGVDMAKYTAEFTDKGELSEESYKELQERGFSKEIVDEYIEGRQAIAYQRTSEVLKEIGGQEQYNAMSEWASEHMSAEELKTYNELVTKDTGSAKMALKYLQSKYTEANGQSPNLISGNTQNNTGDVFKSSFEMTKAMEDKRYWNDPDYQKEVQAKAERSQRAGTI